MTSSKMIDTTNNRMVAKVMPAMQDKKVILHLNVCLFSLCTNLQMNISIMQVKIAAVNGDKNLKDYQQCIP